MDKNEKSSLVRGGGPDKREKKTSNDEYVEPWSRVLKGSSPTDPVITERCAIW